MSTLTPGVRDALVTLLEAAPDYVPEPAPTEDMPDATVPESGAWQAKITLLADVQPERVRWLWWRRIPLGKLTLIDGDPGDGKSTLTLDLAARVTLGREMPDGTASDLSGPGGVVLLSAEDGPADTIRPRFDAAGGDVRRIAVLECAVAGDRERSLTLADLPLIEAAIVQLDARLVVIDPLMAYLGGETNSYRDQDVRAVLSPLARLAERYGVAIVVVRHFAKGATTKVLYKGGGSIGITGAVRAEMMVARDPEEPDGPRRILAQTKSNLGPFPSALAFRLETTANEVAHIVWEGETHHTAEALVAAPPDRDERDAQSEAEEVLRHILAAGRIDVATATAEAKKAGVSERTLKRAKKTLGVVSERNGFGPGAVWFWHLATDGETSKGATDTHSGPYQKDGTLCENTAPYDAYQEEATPAHDVETPHEKPTPEDVAWAKAHIESGALSFAAADMQRIRRLCGGTFDTRSWRAELCERYGWPPPPPLVTPDPTPGEGMLPDSPAQYTREQMRIWLDYAAKQSHLAVIPAGVVQYGTVRGVPRHTDESPAMYVARLQAALPPYQGAET